MKTIREIIIDRLIRNKKLESPSAEEMNQYIIELDSYHDYDLLDEFEMMLVPQD